MRQTAFLLFLPLILLCSCYQLTGSTTDAVDMTVQQRDSVSFHTLHHYAQNYNFVVRRDTLHLSCSPPDELPFDTAVVFEGDRLVVASFMTMEGESADTVWVKVARDQQTQGWVSEGELLDAVIPDDPISWFIHLFSDVHRLAALAITVVVAALYMLRRMLKRRARIVHFRDIASFFPTLLCIVVSSAATLYSSIQMFAPEMWRHFYFHPTLNPFSLPPLLAVFIAMVWLMLIVAIAALDDIRRELSEGEAVVYLLSLLATCAVVYVVFSLATLYFVGYPLLVLYTVFAIRRFVRHSHKRFLCGNCGERLSRRGRCPRCGTFNE